APEGHSRGRGSRRRDRRVRHGRHPGRCRAHGAVRPRALRQRRPGHLGGRGERHPRGAAVHRGARLRGGHRLPAGVHRPAHARRAPHRRHHAHGARRAVHRRGGRGVHGRRRGTCRRGRDGGAQRLDHDRRHRHGARAGREPVAHGRPDRRLSHGHGGVDRDRGADARQPRLPHRLAVRARPQRAAPGAGHRAGLQGGGRGRLEQHARARPDPHRARARPERRRLPAADRDAHRPV
ncbi:MAG: hypothetical protein AVDCRST_MAG40-3432, partial [uncultured Gemmatimonadaceae bacterium]